MGSFSSKSLFLIIEAFCWQFFSQLPRLLIGMICSIENPNLIKDFFKFSTSCS